MNGNLARACRPGRRDARALDVAVQDWISRAQQMCIKSIICLLSDDEVEKFYRREGIELFECYAAAGFTVCRVPVPDHAEPPLSEDDIRRVCVALRELPEPWLVHCSAGIDRTGCVIDFLVLKEAALITQTSSATRCDG